jgi:hypothetical protein
MSASGVRPGPNSNFADNNLVNLGGIAAGLNGNWFLTNTGNDLTTNANNVVATGSPTPGYVTDVPYAGATTRGDVDQTGGGDWFYLYASYNAH